MLSSGVCAWAELLVYSIGGLVWLVSPLTVGLSMFRAGLLCLCIPVHVSFWSERSVKIWIGIGLSCMQSGSGWSVLN